MARVPVTLALAHYDRHVPFLEGTVGVEGADLRVLQVGQSTHDRDGRHRHQRMLRDGEFDVAEVSCSNYLMARDRGAPFTAIPIVPRRLFSQGLFFTRADSPLRGPEDLRGKRVGLNTYQTTLSVLAKGDLAHEYGVALSDVEWVINLDEIIPFDPPADMRITWLPKDGPRIDRLLLDGELDALAMPHPPSSLTQGGGVIRRLFPDARAAELAYYRTHGYWPLMHFLVIRDDVAERHPWLPRALWDGYLAAKAKLPGYWNDPNWSSLVWGPQYREEEARAFGDPWQHGVRAIRANLERFMTYSAEQGLIRAPLRVEDLFHPSVLDT